MADELPSARLPGTFERKRATRCPRHREGLHAGGAKIMVERADRMIADDVAWPGDRERGDRHAASERLELHDAERVGQAREDKDVGGCDMRRKLGALAQAQELGVRESLLQLLLLRSVADDHLG